MKRPITVLVAATLVASAGCGGDETRVLEASTTVSPMHQADGAGNSLTEP